MKNQYVLAAKKALLASLLASIITVPAKAGIPTIDVANITQTTVSAINNVQAVAKQIQQYQTQLQQYQNMLQNTVAPAAYVWDQAQSTINKLYQAQDTLNYYKNQTGSIDAYLKRYQDVSFYRSSPCFKASMTCSDSELQALHDADQNNSEAIKRANDASLKTIDQQQDTLRTDASNLASLQSQASNATGQMQAIQAANQLASAQANQLLQIRSLLVSQQNAATTLAQVQADKEAQQAAASANFRAGTYTKSPAKSW
ncbi:P-type conjugative transfer protein TrbJ [Pantoea agglomerans]|uniref:P-type conjugative transfer protein TrbJ n=1 Tax=Enterobacter agglomerans TaxID=549 RepID=UPI00320A61EC